MILGKMPPERYIRATRLYRLIDRRRLPTKSGALKIQEKGTDRPKESSWCNMFAQGSRFQSKVCTMRFNTLFFLLCLSCLSLVLAQVSYDDCCLKYVRKMSHGARKHAVSYKHQETDGGCNIPAVIFTMRKGRKYCTDPKDTWVIELMMKIDERKPPKSKTLTNKHSHLQN
ncbi:C-C motif chemokine 4 isoform X1 [Channa argus]|uniref:C-C motif chemokine 4 isoform X1 n=1 Tax=Channa argus TaxID=215402 RepID=UPI0035223F4A